MHFREPWTQQKGHKMIPDDPWCWNMNPYIETSDLWPSFVGKYTSTMDDLGMVLPWRKTMKNGPDMAWPAGDHPRDSEFFGGISESSTSTVGQCHWPHWPRWGPSRPRSRQQVLLGEISEEKHHFLPSWGFAAGADARIVADQPARTGYHSHNLEMMPCCSGKNSRKVRINMWSENKIEEVDPATWNPLPHCYFSTQLKKGFSNQGKDPWQEHRTKCMKSIWSVHSTPKYLAYLEGLPSIDIILYII